MLIGIDASRTVIPRRTGTERYALEITRALVAAAPGERIVLYFNRPPPPGLLPRDDRVRWRVIPAPRLWTLARLSAEMLRRPPDVLFVPAHSLPLFQPRATVATVHDLGYLRFPREHGAAVRRLRDAANRWSAGRARLTIAVSRATRDDLVRCYGIPPERIAVVHHGIGSEFRPVDVPGTLAAVGARYGVEAPYFLFVGTLQPRKNYVRLLAAFDRFAASAPGPHLLVLAGARGWQSERLERALADLRARGSVRLLDYVADADLPALMSGALALTLPSLYEGFGLPALEAMACGTPVLASATSSLPEVVGEAGLLVDPLDVDAIAHGLGRLARDASLRAELSARGRARAADFTWERAARETLAVLRNAVGASREAW
jgi:glycosyltransferase involved in cell wall biosynthesis